MSETKLIDRLPPYSEDAERGVLGCVLLDPTCLDDCAPKFKAGAKVFYDARHREIYGALTAMRAANEPIDLLTLSQRLKDAGAMDKAGGLGYLASLPDAVPSAANISSYTDLVQEKYRLRRLVKTCTRAVQKVYEDNGDAGVLLSQIMAGFGTLEEDSGESLDAKGCALALTDELQRRFDLHHAPGGPKRSGLVTGFDLFDHYTDGLQFGEQSIIAARPSMGKTAIALNVCQQVCFTDNIPTAFISLEMPPHALMKRCLAAQCNVTMNELRAGAFSEMDLHKFTGFAAKTSAKPFHIVNGVGGMNTAQVQAVVRRLWRKFGIRLFVIDYLQKIRAVRSNEKRTYEVGEVSESLKALAVETGAAFLTLAQLNRESEKEKGREPRLADLADSGQIERDADLVGLLHRPDRSSPEAKLFISKSRDGECGVVNLTFNGKFNRFENPVAYSTNQTTTEQ